MQDRNWIAEIEKKKKRKGPHLLGGCDWLNPWWFKFQSSSKSNSAVDSVECHGSGPLGSLAPLENSVTAKSWHASCMDRG